MTTELNLPTGVELKDLYVLREGIHYAPNPKWTGGNPLDDDRMIKVTKGDIVHSPSVDLEDRFPGKFHRYEQPRPVLTNIISMETPAIKTKEMELSEASKARTTTPKLGGLGEDVTHQLQIAYDNGFKVYKTASGLFQVVKPGQKKPANDEPLGAEQVKSFIEGLLPR